ncbi:MAG: hypothetical protein RMI04_09230 [Thermofilaceae archaeon]|nr:hypothetical protein [Thermofilaceae archaeon]
MRGGSSVVDKFGYGSCKRDGKPEKLELTLFFSGENMFKQARFMYAWLLLFTLALADLATTVVGLSEGFVEFNPHFPGQLLRERRWGEYIAVNAVVITPFALLYALEDKKLRTAGRAAVYTLAMLRTVAVINNVTLIVL